jgi:hypothetical protein
LYSKYIILIRLPHKVLKKPKNKNIPLTGPMRGGFSRYIGSGPGEPRRACESLKGPIALVIAILF